jgi:microcystin-dependent protein
MKFTKTLTLAAAGITLAMGASTAMACSTEGYLGSVTVFAGNFEIKGCSLAQGQLLSIASNQALFSILGTTYGGDGRTTFGLPDTRGRSVISYGQGVGLSNIKLGEKGGSEYVTLTANNLPAHSHSATTTIDSLSATVHASTSNGTHDSPEDNVWGVLAAENQYRNISPDVNMATGAITVAANATTTTGNAGTSNPDEIYIRDPYLVMNWEIQTIGTYPPRY